MLNNTIRAGFGLLITIIFTSIVFCSLDFVTGNQPAAIDLSKTKIAFQSTRDTGGVRGDIYTMNPDGSQQTRITQVPSDFYTGLGFFEWSPDGSRFIYSANIGPFDNVEMYIINVDGSNKRKIGINLTPVGGGLVKTTSNEDPSWSPDGTRIAFSGGGIGIGNIYTVNADGSNQTRITNSQNYNRNPAWSPDGMTIAYTSTTKGLEDCNIYLMTFDGSHRKILTNLVSQYQKPVWSPNGKKIAFVSWQGSIRELYVIDKNGRNQMKLVDDTTIYGYPVWSPDGRKIAFSSKSTGNSDIYVINADGTGLRNLTNNPAIDGSPSWSPDGSKIAFASWRDGDSEIYVMNADGSQPVRLTFNKASDGRPKWSPVIK